MEEVYNQEDEQISPKIRGVAESPKSICCRYQSTNEVAFAICFGRSFPESSLVFESFISISYQ